MSCLKSSLNLKKTTKKNRQLDNIIGLLFSVNSTLTSHVEGKGTHINIHRGSATLSVFTFLETLFTLICFVFTQRMKSIKQT